MQVRKQQFKLGMEKSTGSKLGKKYVKAVYCHPAYLTSMQSTSCNMPSWMKHKLESRLQGEISTTSDMQMTPPLWQRVRNLRASWWKWKRRVKKIDLKLNSQKTQIMASGPVTSWQIDGQQWRQWQTLFSWDSKSLQMVTTAMKLRCLLLGRKAMTNLDSILKSRDITWRTKIHLVKAMVFPVVMYGFESWTIKKPDGEELMLLNCGVGEDFWESLGLQGEPRIPS